MKWHKGCLKGLIAGSAVLVQALDIADSVVLVQALDIADSVVLLLHGVTLT